MFHAGSCSHGGGAAESVVNTGEPSTDASSDSIAPTGERRIFHESAVSEPSAAIGMSTDDSESGLFRTNHLPHRHPTASRLSPGDNSPSPSRSVPNTASTQLDGVAEKASENDTRLVAMSTDGIGMLVTTSVSANAGAGNCGIVALRANAAKATAVSKIAMCPLMGMRTL